VRIYEKIGTESIQCPYTLHSIGLIYDFQNKIKEAIEYYDRAVVIYQKSGNESTGLTSTLHNIGIIHFNQGKFK
jgi:tetratricopeptide (TPR) repeat protein